MFKVIPEYPTYQINEYGEIYNLIRCVTINPRLQHGKPVVTLIKEGKRKVKRVIDLLLSTWFDTPITDYIFLDGDECNTSINNISIITKPTILMYYGSDKQVPLAKVGEALKLCKGSRNALKRNLLFNNHCYKLSDMRYTLTNDNELVALIDSRKLNEIIEMEGVVDEVIF